MGVAVSYSRDFLIFVSRILGRISSELLGLSHF